MSTGERAMGSRTSIDGVEIELFEQGEGDPILFLHGVEGVEPGAPWLADLSLRHRVIAPSHPGFGQSERPKEFRSISDLAYFYLEFLREHDLEDVTVVGASFGGWLAAEIAVRSQERLSRLVFVDTLGIKVGARDQRFITDMHALDREELAAITFHDPAYAERDITAMSDEELLGVARSREAFTFFGWKPYMNNPGLRRWLRRIRIPTLLVWGESDGIVGLEYARAFAAELPDSRLEVIAEAGHRPYVEQPSRFVEIVDGFIEATTGSFE